MRCCWVCGEATKTTCACGRPICVDHQNFYFDDANVAISNNARAQCVEHFRGRKPYLRPYTLARAIERDEWFAFESRWSE